MHIVNLILADHPEQFQQMAMSCVVLHGNLSGHGTLTLPYLTYQMCRRALVRLTANRSLPHQKCYTVVRPEFVEVCFGAITGHCKVTECKRHKTDIVVKLTI